MCVCVRFLLSDTKTYFCAAESSSFQRISLSVLFAKTSLVVLRADKYINMFQSGRPNKPI